MHRQPFNAVCYTYFSDMLENVCEVFMDDFSVFGNDFNACLANLSKVLHRCMERNLLLNWEKCHFMVREGIVLGHIVSGKGMEVDRAKVQIIEKLPTPTTVRDIRSFLGHAGFYRRYIKDFSLISKPLCSLLMLNTEFVWTKECETSFNKLKTALISSPILSVPNWNLPFEIMCDAK